jgi:hypothetical protein
LTFLGGALLRSSMYDLALPYFDNALRYAFSMPSDVIILRAGCECGAALVTSDP